MISTENTVTPGWQNENMLRAYPLEDDSPAASVLPPWLISDIRITADIDYDFVFISSAYFSDSLLSIGVSGVTWAGDIVGLLTKTVTRDELEPFRTYSMDRLTDTASGAVSFGMPPANADGFKHAFSPQDAIIVSSALVRTSVPGVRRLSVPEYGMSVSGIVDLSGNSEFRTYLDSDSYGKLIIVELTDLYKDIATSSCNKVPSFSACGETPVKTINGVPPDENGTIKLLFR